MGGEEILVLVNEDQNGTVAAAERIRTEIEKSTINYRGEVNVSVTVTIGVSFYRDGMTAKEMMDEADKNLYYGKHNGKNRVVSAL